jgi:hypothetical protein
MLRITTQQTGDVTRLRLEGKLKGPWVTELEALYLARKRSGATNGLVLDIDNLTATDQAGRFLLALIQREGGVLAHTGPRPAYLLCEGVSTPITGAAN